MTKSIPWIAVSVIALPALAQEPEFAVIDLGKLGTGWTVGYGINSEGLVVGSSTDSSKRAFSWSRGVMTDLGILSQGTYSSATKVNDGGRASGNSDTTDDQIAVIWEQDGSITQLGVIGTYSEAWDINNAGQVVGQAEVGADGPPVMWDNGSMIELGDLGGVNVGEALAISDSTVIVGWAAGPESGRPEAFVWVNGTMSPLPGLGEPIWIAQGVNDSGVATGLAEDGPFARAVVWQPQIQPIDTHIQAVESNARAINNLGEVVGTFTNFIDDFAFVYRDGEMLALDDLIPPNSGWNLTWAFDINDDGLIVGQGFRDGAQYPNYCGFLTVPVNPLLALSQPSPGLSDQNNTLVATGATPGNRIYFVYGTRGGGTIIPTCDLADATVQIDNAKIAGSAIADASGTATLTAFVPVAASNLGDILIQAVDPATCMQSQLVVEVFE